MLWYVFERYFVIEGGFEHLSITLEVFPNIIINWLFRRRLRWFLTAF